MAGMSGDIEYDQYGFERPPDFDHESYETFISEYLQVLARRAAKWEKLLSHDENNSAIHKSRRAKRYVRKGVPSEHRGEIWLAISGAKRRMEENPDKYKELLNGEKDESIVELVQRDVRRTYPENVYFRDVSNSQLTPLSNVLVCYAHYNKRIGYCQGFNYIVGMLLIVTKSEEQSFWLLVELVDRLLPDFYSSKMLGLRVECGVVEEFLKLKSPDLYSHFQANQIDLNLTSSKWFICLYMDVLPVEHQKIRQVQRRFDIGQGQPPGQPQ